MFYLLIQMTRKIQDNQSDMIKFTLLGVLLGVATSVLLAPEKGSVTRKKIMRPIDDKIDQLTLKGQGVIDKIAMKMNQAMPV